MTRSERVDCSVSGLRLCFVQDNFAWFTDAPLDEVWGDDWNDAPHDCNAGTPYEKDGQRFVKVAFDGDLEVVSSWDRDAGARPQYAVEHQYHYVSADDCNAGVPWLIQPSYGYEQYPTPLTEIHGGADFDTFCGLVAQAKGTVYVPRVDRTQADRARRYRRKAAA